MKMESSWFVRKQWSDYNCSANSSVPGRGTRVLIMGMRGFGSDTRRNHFKPQEGLRAVKRFVFCIWKSSALLVAALDNLHLYGIRIGPWVDCGFLWFPSLPSVDEPSNIIKSIIPQFREDWQRGSNKGIYLRKFRWISGNGENNYFPKNSPWFLISLSKRTRPDYSWCFLERCGSWKVLLCNTTYFDMKIFFIRGRFFSHFLPKIIQRTNSAGKVNTSLDFQRPKCTGYPCWTPLYTINLLVRYRYPNHSTEINS